MNRFSIIVFWLFLFIVQRSSCDPTNVQKLKSYKSLSFLDKIRQFTGQTQSGIDDFSCPKNWSRLLDLCYHLSSYMSTVGQANQTCSIFHLNDSRLMYVKNPLEVFYAAHVMTEHNLGQLLLEIDRDLMKGGRIAHILSSNDPTQWEEFGKRFLRENHDDNTRRQSTDENKIESATVAGKMISIADIRESCHQIEWNVIYESSNVLILTIESESNQFTCSLSNAPLTSAYSHLCQYVLNRCENNLECGGHGRCINGETGFNCSCSFLYTGERCEKWSHTDIQIIVAIIAMIIGAFWLYPGLRGSIFDAIKWFINLCRQQPIPPPTPASPQATDDDNNDTEPVGEEPRVQWPAIDQPAEQEQYEFRLEPSEQCLRNIFLVILTIVSFLLLFKFPTPHYIRSSELNRTDSLNNNVHTTGQYRRYAIFRLDNFIYLSISGVLVLAFSILLRKEKRYDKEDDDRSGLVEPIKLLRISDRYETTAIIVIQMFEILEVLGETMVDIDESARYGVFAQILKRVFFIILIALRYYPTLASLQFQGFLVRLLIVTYFIGSMTHKTLFESSGIPGLLFLIKYRQSTQLFSWSFIHGSIRNAVHYSFVGYVCGELIMRLLYDSIYIALKRGKIIWEIPYRTIEQYSYKADREKKRFIRKSKKKTTAANSNQQGCLYRIRGFVTSIYQWDKTFRYTTIVVCTYTVAYLFLFHLTGTVILIYNTQTNDYIRHIKEIFKVILHIEMKEESFQTEVIISAILTITIYSIQLFLSMKNFRQSMGRLYTEHSADRELGKKLKKREIIRKSTQYPSYLLLYLLGGYFICFHLILFISVTLKRLMFTRVAPSKTQATVGYIVPILVLYFLQKIIIRCLHKAFDYFDRRQETSLNLNLNILDSILLYLKLISCAFIGIIASIIRLIISVLVNIIFMPRIDYSYLVEPLRGIDSAHESFRAFLRLEILVVNQLILEFSPVDQVSIATNPPILPRESPSMPPSQDQSTTSVDNYDGESLNSVGESVDDHQPPGSNTAFADRNAIETSLLFPTRSNNRQ